MSPDPYDVDACLIRDALGWSIVDDPEAASSFPAAYWSGEERCFRVLRSPEADPEPFRPTRSFYDALEVQESLDPDRVFPVLSRPVFEGHVRVLADIGREELVAEGRCLPRVLSVALYEALRRLDGGGFGVGREGEA